jgi:alpha-beta hydrolase superfamily lysophospholipase
MAEQSVSFTLDDLTLAGTVKVPDGVAPGERRPAFIVLHGFGSHSGACNVLQPCAMFEQLGYVTMRFDMPGCGKSDGEKGLLLCPEQVRATSAALTELVKNANVDPDRVAVLGSSFGAAVAVYAGAVDKRFAAVVSASGWGDGERKFRGQHPGEAAWAKFTAMLEQGRGYRAKHGKPLMVPRYDIVPIPEALRTHVLPGSVQSFPSETAQSMYDFRANEVVGQIAPRPLLMLHSSDDHVTPVTQSIELFQNAGQPSELHLFADTDHFMFAEGNTRVHNVLTNWLANYFPVKAAA